MLQSMRASAKYIFWFLLIAFVGGFLFTEASGLLGLGGITPTTPVAVVNGTDIRYVDWTTRVSQEIQAAQQGGRSLTQDETREIENAVFDQMVADLLLQQEYRRRGITVSDEEIRQYARFAPPPWVRNAPDLQTDGRFDPAKYQRFLGSAAARQQGILASLEQYYRTEVPKEKLFEQVAAGVYITDAELWRTWRDQHDSVRVSYVAFRPDSLKPDPAISDADLRRYFEANKRQYERAGRAVLSVVEIPRVVTAADSAAVRARAEALRAEILGGASFEDVARRESSDSASGADGGNLGRGARGRFVPEFEAAAYALQPGQVSSPVLSSFGYHLIRVDERKGDTLALRHILLRMQPSDSSAVRIDRLADELSRQAANAGRTEGARLDAAAQKLGLKVVRVTANEGQPAVLDGRLIPSVSAWAFGGARTGETSDLFDAENGYYLARLDSIVPGGEPSFDRVKDEVRMDVTRERALEKLVAPATRLATAAAQTSLEQAAQAQGLTVASTPMFGRGSVVPGLGGQLTRAIGAAFGLPPAVVSAPVKGREQVTVLRVDARVPADSAAWAAQKDMQRQQRLGALRQQRVQLFMEDLRKEAKVDDRRRKIQDLARRSAES